MDAKSMGADHKKESAIERFAALCKDARAVQENFLLARLAENKDTEYGKRFGFAGIHTVEAFQSELPITFPYDYEDAVNRQMEQGFGALTEEMPVYYCISNGAADAPKCLPVLERDILLQQFYWEELFRELMLQQIPGAAAQELFGKIFETGEFRRSFMPDGTMSGMRVGALYRYLEVQGELDMDSYTSPIEVMFPEDREELLYVKLRFALACRDVTAIHGVFVNRVVGVFRYLADHWDAFLADIETGKVNERFAVSDGWRAYLEERLPADPGRAEELRAIPREDLEQGLIRKVWPKLRYGRMIGGSLFAPYMEKLRVYVEDLPIHFFTYAASEGLFGIPKNINDKDAYYVLLPDACFYEFLSESGEGDRIYTIRDVEVGSKYELLITTLSGLYRYAMDDVVEVVGFEGQAPIVRFCYRKSQLISVADEKMNVRQLESAMGKFQERAECVLEGYCADGAHAARLPYYILYLELAEGSLPENAAEILDGCLMESCSGYKRDRELAEIAMVKIQPIPKGGFRAFDRFMAMLERRKEQDNPLRVLQTEEQRAFFGGALAGWEE